MSFINYHQDRGHVFGECWSYPDSEFMYINIPKNATSWTKQNLQNWGWECYNYHIDNLKKTPIIVLRDPVDRWLSGIGEYMYLYHRNINIAEFNEAFHDLVFDKIAFDDHTERQVYFLEGLELTNAIYFEFGTNYRQNFRNFLISNQMPDQYSRYEYQHVSDDSPERRQFKKIFGEQIQRSKYLYQIEQYFKPDYELIEKVEFYGTR
jgi:hypothetical protein